MREAQTLPSRSKKIHRNLIVFLFLVATVDILFKTIITITNLITIRMDENVQELNKAQLKPFLMRIWGQVGRTKCLYDDMRIYEGMRISEHLLWYKHMRIYEDKDE